METMPRWARKIDEAGPGRWRKEKRANRRKGEYIAAIIGNIIWFYIANKLPSWHLGFINDRYFTVLPLLNLNIYLQIAANFILFLIDFRVLRYLLRAVMEAASFIMLILFYYLYPFNFANIQSLSWLDAVLPIIFIIGMVVSALKVLSNVWKMIFWRE